MTKTEIVTIKTETKAITVKTKNKTVKILSRDQTVSRDSHHSIVVYATLTVNYVTVLINHITSVSYITLYIAAIKTIQLSRKS